MSGVATATRPRNTNSSSPPPVVQTGLAQEQAAWLLRVLKVTSAGQSGGKSGDKKPYMTRRQQLQRDQDERSKKAQEEATALDNELIDGLPKGTDTDAIRAIMAEHTTKMPEESKVFSGLIDFQSIQELAKDKREPKLREIGTVLADVKDRTMRLREAVSSAPRPYSEKDAEAVGQGYKLLARMTQHIPGEFLALGDQLQDRIKTMCADKDEKAKILAKEKQGFLDKNGNDITATLKQPFKDVIEPVGTKKFERLNFFFDEFVAAPKAVDLDKLGKITDMVVQKGYRIMDAGGSLDDVTALMEKTGIPETWWPPAFVETLQAWRKTERELQKDRVKELMAQHDYDFTKPGDVLKFFQDAAHDVGNEGGSDAKKAFARILETREVGAAVTEFTESVKARWGFAKEAGTAFETLDFSTLEPSVAKQLTDNILSAETKLTTVISTMSSGSTSGIAKDLLPEVAKLGAELAPGIAIAVAGIKLGIALARLAEHSAIAIGTRGMQGDAQRQLGRRELQDGGAFVHALGNELDARHRQITKDGVAVVEAGLDLTGALIEAGAIHVGGTGVKLGLKIVGKAITYGSSAVFTGIDWSLADRAKTLMKEAQAGNPVARIQIFEDSATYAKMYICILVRDNNPLALRFIEQRGITESDLSAATSLSILATALRADADQKAEAEIPDGFADAMSGGVIGKIKNYGGKAVDAISKKASTITKESRDTPYDPNWTFTGPIVLTADAWQGVKDAAYKAGLFDEASGIGDALKTAGPLLAAARQGGKSAGPLASPEMKKQRQTCMQAIAALQATRSAVWSYAPLANPDDNDKQESHKGMTLYLVQLSDTVTAAIDEIEKLLLASGLKQPKWDPKMPSDPLDAKAWATKWTEGREVACLPAADAGIGAALTSAASARDKRGKLDRAKDPQDHRRASVALQDALGEVVAASLAGLSLVGGVPLMLAYVQAVRDAAAAEARKLDGDLSGDGWNAPPVDAVNAVTSIKWQAMWDAAGKAGMCNLRAGDGKLGAAFVALEKQLATIGKSEKDPKKQVRARQELAKSAGGVLLAFEAFRRAQPGVAEPMMNYAVNLRKRSQQEMSASETARAEVPFRAAQNVAAVAWGETYKAAVAAGAVVEANSEANDLTKAMGEYEKKAAAFANAVKGGASKESRKAATEVVGTLTELVKAFNKVMAIDGYSANATMGKYLLAVQAKIKEWRTAPALTKALGGGDDSKFAPATFAIDPDSFSKVKAEAEKLGVIQDGIKTGMGDALKAAKASLAEYGKKKGATSAKDKEAAEKLRVKARADVVKLKAVVDKLAGLSESAKWKTYAGQAVTACDNQLTALGPA